MTAAASSPLGNLLGRETSPYLRQHQHQPVAWRPWGPAALAEAAALDRPILLSVGYAACHWCHVMAEESFDDPAIAAAINRAFIPIKVDREERPDVDAIYQHALAVLGQSGGWPLTMFLTPAGEPFWGGTYFPPTARWGRPGFTEVLAGLSGLWAEQREKLDRNIKVLSDGLRHLTEARPGPLPDPAILDEIALRFARAVDPVHGGIGNAPKFPQAGILELLWRAGCRTGDPALFDPVLLTLDRMSEGGIYDHLGGGYARYSVDERWLVPHFEKMLYDNAQLITLLSRAWARTGKPLYRQRVEETIGWLVREMRLPGGGFAASLDADSEHEEGRFYIWSAAEIAAVLGEEAAFFARHYDVGPEGNWEGKIILNRLNQPAPTDPAGEARLAAARARLLAVRAGRVRPGLDDKVLADWNGLLIEALAVAAQIFDRPDWLALARGAWDFVRHQLGTGDGRLAHSWCHDQTHPGTLDDHAAMARAGLRLWQISGDPADLAAVEGWLGQLDRHFAADSGGFYLSADDTADLIVRPLSVQDGAVPNGNGVLVEVFQRLWLLTGEPRWREAAEAQIEAFAGELERSFYGLASWLNGLDLIGAGRQLVLIGAADDPARAALERVAHAAGSPALILQTVLPGQDLPAGHPAAGKTALDGRATAYLCDGARCSLPITSPAALDAALSRPSRHA